MKTLATTARAAKALGVSEQTLHRWRNQYGGMKAEDVKRLKELEKENRELKQIVADQTLDIRAYKEIAFYRREVDSSVSACWSGRRCVPAKISSSAAACIP
jgi:transposase-like protein